MPFPIIYGLPDQMPKQDLVQLRQQLIDAISTAMNVEAHTVRPFFPQDLVGDPNEGQDATVLCEIKTGMFDTVGEETDALAQATTDAVATTIFNFLGEMLDVEVFIGHVDGHTKTHLRTITEVVWNNGE